MTDKRIEFLMNHQIIISHMLQSFSYIMLHSSIPKGTPFHSIYYIDYYASSFFGVLCKERVKL